MSIKGVPEWAVSSAGWCVIWKDGARCAKDEFKLITEAGGVVAVGAINDDRMKSNQKESGWAALLF